MTEAEKIWTERVKAVCAERGLHRMAYDGADRTVSIMDEAACRLIEEHQAYRQEVSDAITAFRKVLERGWCTGPNTFNSHLSRFIIAKPEPDPLEAAMRKALPASMPDHHVTAICKNLRRELPGLKIVEVDDD